MVVIGSDYPDLQSAFVALGANSGPQDIYIPPGHLLTKGLSLIDGDWSRFTIRSDADVFLSPGFVGVSESPRSPVPGSEFMTAGLIYGCHARMPVIDARFNMENRFQDGIYVDIDSSVVVNSEKGVIYAGRHGLQARSSRVVAESARFNYANECGLRIQQTSQLTGYRVYANNCVRRGAGNGAAIFVSRGSSAYINEALARNSGDMAIANHRSLVVAQATDCSNAAVSAMRVEQGGRTIANSAKLENSGSYPISAASEGGGSFDDCSTLNHHAARSVHMSEAGRVSARRLKYTGVLSNISAGAITSNGTLII